jgi:hypothetical protein
MSDTPYRRVFPAEGQSEWTTVEEPMGVFTYYNVKTGEKSGPHRIHVLLASNRGHEEDLLPLSFSGDWGRALGKPVER